MNILNKIKLLDIRGEHPILFLGPITPPHPFTPIGPIRAYVLRYLKQHGIKPKIVDREHIYFYPHAKILISISSGQYKSSPEVNWNLIGQMYHLTDYREHVHTRQTDTFVSLPELVRKIQEHL